LDHENPGSRSSISGETQFARPQLPLDKRHVFATISALKSKGFGEGRDSITEEKIRRLQNVGRLKIHVHGGVQVPAGSRDGNLFRAHLRKLQQITTSNTLSEACLKGRSIVTESNRFQDGA
jgi:hypothetical protein